MLRRTKCQTNMLAAEKSHVVAMRRRMGWLGFANHSAKPCSARSTSDRWDGPIQPAFQPIKPKSVNHLRRAKPEDLEGHPNIKCLSRRSQTLAPIFTDFTTSAFWSTPMDGSDCSCFGEDIPQWPKPPWSSDGNSGTTSSNPSDSRSNSSLAGLLYAMLDPLSAAPMQVFPQKYDNAAPHSLFEQLGISDRLINVSSAGRSCWLVCFKPSPKNFGRCDHGAPLLYALPLLLTYCSYYY